MITTKIPTKSIIIFHHLTNYGYPYQNWQKKQSHNVNNCQYQRSTTQQVNASHIPKASWQQLPPHAKTVIAGAQHSKLQAYTTTGQSHGITEHSVRETLPMYVSNTVHHTPIDTAPPSGEQTALLNSNHTIIFT